MRGGGRSLSEVRAKGSEAERSRLLGHGAMRPPRIANPWLLLSHQEGLSCLVGARRVRQAWEQTPLPRVSPVCSPHAFGSTLAWQFCSDSSGTGQVSALTASVVSTDKFGCPYSFFKASGFGAFLLWENCGFH